MAAVVEIIGRQIRDIRIDDHHAHQSFALVERLHTEPGRNLADPGIDKVAGVDFASAEAEVDFGGGVEVGKHVGDDVHLGDTLHEDETSVFAPLAVGEVAVDGAVHVT